VIGEKFTRLTVLNAPVKVGRRYKANCLCDCGNTVMVDTAHLRSGHTASCGCLQRDDIRQRQTKHGRYYEPEFLAWSNMKKRCVEPRYAKWYAGVSVCDRWLQSYDAFLADVGRKPSSKHSLDRIDSKGNYEPNNVRWATRNTQSRNTKVFETSATKIKGVTWSKDKQKWRASIYVNNVQKHLGYFDDIKLAADARTAGERKYWAALHDKRAISDIAMEALK
jgi:uncharacterized protein YkuJ